MSNLYNEHIIEKLNKNRDKQKKLLARRNMLAEYIEMHEAEMETVYAELKAISIIIKDLRSKL